TLVAASVAVVRDRHIRVEILFYGGSKARRRWLGLLSALATIVAFAILAALGGKLAWDDYQYEVTSPGIGIPQWWYTGTMPVLCIGVTWRAIQHFVAVWKHRLSGMIAALSFLAFALLLVLGVPIGVALMIGGSIAIGAAELGWLSLPNNFYAGIAKYPLLALPMFVLVGVLFERSGVAERLVTFASSIFGRGPGMLPTTAILVAMMMGGISGSGPATAAAVGGVMLVAMHRAGYPAPFSASVIGAAAAIDILIPPSIAFIVYSVLVPGASVPALFAAGLIPGLLTGITLIIPAIWLSRRHGFGMNEGAEARPPFWRSLRDASWGLI